MSPRNFKLFLPRFCDQDINIVTLPRLIEPKRAARRLKDFETVAELETLLQEQNH